jgi:hypothetical protein
MALIPGDNLGPCEIISMLGKGRKGEVWKARDTRLNRIVAMNTSKALRWDPRRTDAICLILQCRSPMALLPLTAPLRFDVERLPVYAAR